jgi:hypothetical protein
MKMKKYRNIKFLNWILILIFLLSGCSADIEQLGQNEAIRVYVEFADGTNRGLYNSETGTGGFIDEPYDATTAMVINWHKLPENKTTLNTVLEFRIEHPSVSKWQAVEGYSQNFGIERRLSTVLY